MKKAPPREGEKVTLMGCLLDLELVQMWVRAWVVWEVVREIGSVFLSVLG